MESVPARNNRQLTRFFMSLALQAASQAFSYPLAAMVASRGPGGPLNLAGLAQSTTIMIFLGMFCISYITTGMIYATSREGYQKFRDIVLITGFGVITVQAALCIPWLSHLLFGNLIGLPPSIASPAKITLLATIIASGFLLLLLGAPGFIICAAVLPAGSLASSATMRALMSRSRPKPTPIAPTTTSVGHVR